MSQNELLQVSIDKELAGKMLNGLYSGAEGKALKVVIDVGGRYHINSKGLNIVLEVNPSGIGVRKISVSNDKMYAVLTEENLREMRLDTFANNVHFALRDKYSPYFHSLADNIVVFSRAYWNDSIDYS